MATCTCMSLGTPSSRPASYRSEASCLGPTGPRTRNPHRRIRAVHERQRGSGGARYACRCRAHEEMRQNRASTDTVIYVEDLCTLGLQHIGEVRRRSTVLSVRAKLFIDRLRPKTSGDTKVKTVNSRSRHSSGLCTTAGRTIAAYRHVAPMTRLHDRPHGEFNGGGPAPGTADHTIPRSALHPRSPNRARIARRHSTTAYIQDRTIYREFWSPRAQLPVMREAQEAALIMSLRCV